MKRATELLVSTYLTGRANSNDQNPNGQNDLVKPSHPEANEVSRRTSWIYDIEILSLRYTQGQNDNFVVSFGF